MRKEIVAFVVENADARAKVGSTGPADVSRMCKTSDSVRHVARRK